MGWGKKGEASEGEARRLESMTRELPLFRRGEDGYVKW